MTLCDFMHLDGVAQLEVLSQNGLSCLLGSVKLRLDWLELCPGVEFLRKTHLQSKVTHEKIIAFSKVTSLG